MASKPTPSSATVSGVVSLLRQAPSRGRGRRSPVMIWMQQNRKELEAAFLQDTPAWNVIASYLGDNGIMNGDGKPPTAASARSAWARVKAEAKAKVKGLGAPAAATPAPATSPAPSVPSDGQEPPRPMHERFTTATLRNHTPAAPPPDPPPPLPTVPRQDSKAVIAALVGRGARPSGFRKPEPKDE